MEIFFSYSHQDEALRDELAKHLTNLKRSGTVSAWHDRQITAGSEWEREIDEHLNTADIVLLLVSPDFIASDYCYDVEMMRAMERHHSKEAHTIPIILRPVNWHDTPFAKLQALPKNGKPITQWSNQDEAFLEVANGIREVIKAIDEQGIPSVTDLVEVEKVNRDDAILLVRTVNPPRGEKLQQSGIWLSAVGTTTYFVDSLTIEHVPGYLSSIGSGAMPPDATYQFTFEYGSRKTHILNPALVLSAEDRREVYFTLGLAPAGFFRTVGGTVLVTLHYHTPKGLFGQLQLREPSLEGRFLASLLRTDIEVYGLTVTPGGLQRGKHNAESISSSLIYEPLRVPGTFLFEYKFHIETNPASVKLTDERKALNHVLESTGAVDVIFERLKSGDELAFDLATGLTIEEVDDRLIMLGSIKGLVAPVIHSLAIRHLISPTTKLAEFILNIPLSGEQISQLCDFITYKEEHGTSHYLPWFSEAIRLASRALGWHPLGDWFAALVKLASGHRDAILPLYLRRSELSPQMKEEVDDVCRRHLQTRFPDEVAVKYLRWRGYALDGIRGV